MFKLCSVLCVREDLDVLYSAGEEEEGDLVPGFPGRGEAEQVLLHGCGLDMTTLPKKPPPAPGAAGASEHPSVGAGFAGSRDEVTTVCIRVGIKCN